MKTLVKIGAAGLVALMAAGCATVTYTSPGMLDNVSVKGVEGRKLGQAVLIDTSGFYMFWTIPLVSGDLRWNEQKKSIEGGTSFFKDQVDALFSGSLKQVAVGLCITAALLVLSDQIGKRIRAPRAKDTRNGISYGQAAIVGVAQAFAVVPGVSRSGSTIATGLLSGVKREVMAQFSFLMVLIPIIGEQSLDLLKVAVGKEVFGTGVGPAALVLGFAAAFLAGLFACKVMIAIVRKARLTWFAAYCLLVAILIFILA